jgi:hypothetical protein
VRREATVIAPLRKRSALPSPCRRKHRANLSWIADCQVAPIAAITHIAEIDHIEPYGDEGKFKVVFRGAATPLEHPVPYGDAPSGAMQGPRYTTKAALLAAKCLRDLTK